MEELSSEIYEQRLLVFLETGPQTNKYRQVLFNSEEFKKISLSIGKVLRGFDESGMQVVETHESEEEYLLPDLQSINP